MHSGVERASLESSQQCLIQGLHLFRSATDRLQTSPSIPGSWDGCVFKRVQRYLDQALSGGKKLVHIVGSVDGAADANLPKVVKASGSLGLLFGTAQSRQQHRGQNRNDRDDHQ